MNRLLLSLTLAVSCANLFGIAPTLARELKTMRFENDLPRPTGVVIAGARADQVVLYCTQANAGCQGLRAHFAKLGLDYVDKDPQADPQAGAEFDALGGQGIPLVVFKQRLMHGYYPSSFDTLYAQYHTGSKPVPANTASPSGPPAQPAPAAPSVQAAAHPASNLPRGATVEDISPEALQAYLNRHTYVVVLYTSPDTTCPPCVKSQPDFGQAAAGGLSIIHYARVQWSPWYTTQVVLKPLFDKGYLPAITVYQQGKAIAHQAGGVDAHHLNAYMEKRFGFAP